MCVAHLQSVTAAVNRELQWIRVQVGLDPDPEPTTMTDAGIPWYTPPIWAVGIPMLDVVKVEEVDGCPF